MFPHSLPLLDECLPDAWTSIGVPRLREDDSDGDQERPIGSPPSILGPSPLCIMPRRGYGQGSAHETNGIATVVFLNGAISHRDSFVKNAAAGPVPPARPVTIVRSGHAALSAAPRAIGREDVRQSPDPAPSARRNCPNKRSHLSERIWLSRRESGESIDRGFSERWLTMAGLDCGSQILELRASNLPIPLP